MNYYHLKKYSINLNIYFLILKDNFKKYGYRWIIKKIITRILKEFIWILLLPISIIFHYIGFRKLLIRIEHIGHLTTEIDTFIKASKLEMLPVYHYFVIASEKKIANQHLLKYWRKYIRIISNPLFCPFLEILTRRFFMCDKSTIYKVGFFGDQPIYNVNRLWGNRPPLLQLDNTDNEFAEITLKELGIYSKWFVCIHVREGGFLPHNELIQSHRNATITNTILAMKEIIKRGGMVIRMGDSTMTPLPKMHGVIDYAHHPLKSNRMDVILCAKAKFFLGCTSGLAFLSMVFGIPIAHANMIPVETLGIGPHDLSIPKLLLNESNSSLIHFKEILSTEIGGYFFTYQYKNSGVIPIENSPEDILDLTVEMLERLNKKFIYSRDDEELHQKYISFIKKNHYSYLAASRIGMAFLKKYKHLIA